MRNHHRVDFEGSVSKAFHARIRILTGEKERLFSFPNRPEQSFSRLHRMKPDIVLHCLRSAQTLLRDLQRHFDQGRAISRNKAWDKHFSGSIDEIKRATMRIGDPGGTLNDEPVEIRWPQIVRERFAQTVEKIEYPVLLDL
jgi:hypothetical protein